MELIVIGSSSKGNCYLLKGKTETLILEAGIRFTEVKRVLDFDMSSIVGCLITHEHGDHAKYVKEVLQCGINVYTSSGTKRKIQPINTRLITPLFEDCTRILGSFTIKPFGVIHDAEEPYGFLIKHPECGLILFVTDTHYIPFKISGLQNILCEVNYDINIANENIANGASQSVRDRVLETHMELTTFCDFLKENDTTKLNNVVLLHLSDGNSNASQFKQTIESVIPGKQVWIADKDLRINLDSTPF